jgi:hypothetical protein
MEAAWETAEERARRRAEVGFMILLVVSGGKAEIDAVR